MQTPGDHGPVGFVGLGNMGQPLSRNLLAAGYSVLGYDLKPNEAFAAAGGTQVATLAALAPARTVLLSLPNAGVVRAAVDALLMQDGRDRLVIDLSSTALADKRAQADRLAAHGATMLDCEVSGLPAMAEQRRAVIFTAGDAAAVRRAGPLFDAMAEEHFLVGDFGAATRLKLIANTMVCVHNLMAAEALNLGARAGLSPELMVKVLGPSAAGSTTFRNKAPLMLARQFAKGKGPFRHMFGYLARAAELAAQHGADTPLLDATRAVYAQAEQQGRHDEDIAAMLEIIESRSAGHTSRSEDHE